MQGSTGRLSLWRPFLIAAASVVALGLSTATAQAAEAQTRAFVFSKFHWGLYFDADFDKVCPNGWLPDTETAYLATLPQAERQRLLKPENAQELIKGPNGGFLEGPGGEDQCVNPMSFKGDPRFPPALDHFVQSKVSYGLDLDGDSSGAAPKKSCAHKNFVSPNGKRGIDNQHFRAIGCSRLWRGSDEKGGDNIQYEQQYMLEGNYTYLMEVRGITDMRNDDVEVHIFSSPDNAYINAQGQYMTHQTYTVTANKRWHNVMRGKIVNGVLSTNPIDWLRLDHSYPTPYGTGMGAAYERAVRDARFELTFNKDGSVSGVMGGYQAPVELEWKGRAGGKGEGSIAGRACGVEHNTYLALADGYPDPVTGECTMLSTAYVIEGVPAFLVHPESDKANSGQTAALKDSADKE